MCKRPVTTQHMRVCVRALRAFASNAMNARVHFVWSHRFRRVAPRPWVQWLSDARARARAPASQPSSARASAREPYRPRSASACSPAVAFVFFPATRVLLATAPLAAARAGSSAARPAVGSRGLWRGASASGRVLGSLGGGRRDASRFVALRISRRRLPGVRWPGALRPTAAPTRGPPAPVPVGVAVGSTPPAPQSPCPPARARAEMLGGVPRALGGAATRRGAIVRRVPFSTMGRGSKKYYAIANGRSVGVYDSWSDAAEQVTGYSNSVFKGFSTRQEAEQYMADHGHGMSFVCVGNSAGVIAVWIARRSRGEGGAVTRLSAVSLLEVPLIGGGGGGEGASESGVRGARQSLRWRGWGVCARWSDFARRPLLFRPCVLTPIRFPPAFFSAQTRTMRAGTAEEAGATLVAEGAGAKPILAGATLVAVVGGAGGRRRDTAGALLRVTSLGTPLKNTRMRTTTRGATLPTRTTPHGTPVALPPGTATVAVCSVRRVHREFPTSRRRPRTLLLATPVLGARPARLAPACFPPSAAPGQR